MVTATVSAGRRRARPRREELRRCRPRSWAPRTRGCGARQLGRALDPRCHRRARRQDVSRSTQHWRPGIEPLGWGELRPRSHDRPRCRAPARPRSRRAPPPRCTAREPRHRRGRTRSAGLFQRPSRCRGQIVGFTDRHTRGETDTTARDVRESRAPRTRRCGPSPPRRRPMCRRGWISTPIPSHPAGRSPGGSSAPVASARRAGTALQRTAPPQKGTTTVGPASGTSSIRATVRLRRRARNRPRADCRTVKIRAPSAERERDHLGDPGRHDRCHHRAQVQPKTERRACGDVPIAEMRKHDHRTAVADIQALSADHPEELEHHRRLNWFGPHRVDDHAHVFLEERRASAAASA